MNKSLHDVDKSFKWKKHHDSEYRKAGLLWPPVFERKFHEMILQNGVGDREAQYIHFLDRVSPMQELTIEEELVDLSQSLGRESGRHAGRIPCITPNSRLWLRRRRRWLLPPEAIVAQGFDVPPQEQLQQFGHRQLLDLIGNSFHGDSLLISIAVAIASAPSLQSGIAKAQLES